MCNLWQKVFCIGIAVFLVGSSKPIKEKQPMLVLDEEFTYEIPRNFRCTQDVFRDIQEGSQSPTREGLNELHAATSAQFSEKTLKAALKRLQAPIWVIDLRRESHAYVNGIPISWYKPHNDSNQNLDTKTLMQIEQKMVSELKQHNPLTIQHITSKTAGIIHSSEPFDVKIERLETEQQLTKRLGLEYRRLQVLDRNKPDDNMVDEFIEIVKTLPPNATLYFHCRGGKGRSTTFMILYDMLKNAKTVPLAEIVLRQERLGGVNVFNTQTKPGGEWMAQMRLDRKAFIEEFYLYASDGKGYPNKSWSEWLQARENI
jgi:protein-tyrosine phosphatase